MSEKDEKQYREAQGYFAEGLARMNLVLTAEQISMLIRYCLELRKWNARVNLVARNTSLRDLIDRHFLDSLTLVPLLRKEEIRSGPLLDVGSGAGFPGLVTGIACPELSVVLLEPRQRRVSFLRHIIRLLSLKNIAALARRTEDREIMPPHGFAVITGRAVADVSGFLTMIEPLASRKTLVICMQGEGGRQGWEQQGQSGPFHFIGGEKAILPLTGAGRHLLLFSRSS